jgi:hypothetical protein
MENAKPKQKGKTMLYKHPGDKVAHKISVKTIIVDASMVNEMLKEGWSKTPKAAKELFEEVTASDADDEITEGTGGNELQPIEEWDPEIHIDPPTRTKKGLWRKKPIKG